jgi:solute carrier family 35 protein E2
MPDRVDEEIGSLLTSASYENECEMSSPLLGNGNGIVGGGGGGSGGGGGGGQHAKKSSVTNIKQQRLLSSSLTFPSSSSSSAAALDRKNGDANDKRNDVRSRSHFLKTAFWITAWYGTSLATLFLNKIILSRPDSSVHVLGMCQMTAAAVLGGWSAFGCTGIVVGAMTSVLRRCARFGDGPSASGTTAAAGARVATAMRGVVGGGGHGGRADEESAVGGSSSFASSSSSSNHANKVNNSQARDPLACPSTPSKSPDRATYHFVRDMSVVGVLRGLTVSLGLIALEHVPVSFVETIKATAPAFTVVFARLILQERTPPPVMLSLVPVVGGLVLCSASELRFDAAGFAAALANNCADCVQNVLSKRLLAHMAPTTLQFYASAAALALQAPFLLRDAAGLAMGRWSRHGRGGVAGETDVDDWGGGAVPLRDATEDDEFAPSTAGSPSWSLSHRDMSMARLLMIDAVFYHLQSVSAYCTMGCMNPVSQSVANTLKRALLVWASILYFGNPVTHSGIAGVIMVVAGVFLYNHVRRIHHS